MERNGIASIRKTVQRKQGPSDLAACPIAPSNNRFRPAPWLELTLMA